MPSGILNESVHCVIGNGVVVHLRGLLKELEALRAAGVQYDGRLHLSDRAHIVFDFHQAVDGYQENHLAGKKIGTTLKGIGPAYSSKTQRNGVRVGDLQDMAYFEARLRSLAEQLMRSHPGLEIDVEAEIAYYNSIRDELLPLITDTVAYCNEALATGKDVLVEGANATSTACTQLYPLQYVLFCLTTAHYLSCTYLAVLDLDFGTFPYVTSSNPSVGSACTGLGVPPRDIHGVAGVVKVSLSPGHPTQVVGDCLMEPPAIGLLHPRGRGPFPHRTGGRRRGAAAREGRRVRHHDWQAPQVRLDRHSPAQTLDHGKSLRRSFDVLLGHFLSAPQRPHRYR